jgi:hypothetical protein
MAELKLISDERRQQLAQKQKRTEAAKKRPQKPNRPAVKLKSNRKNKTLELDPKDYDYTCYIVGSGPSMKTFNWALLDDPKKFVVIINNNYTKLPNAQILYCTDEPWVKEHANDIEDFAGVIYQGVLNLSNPPKHPVIDKRWHLTGPHGYETREGSLRHGSNSAYAAINMCAAHLGFKKIYLVGIDMKWGQKGNKKTSHWHSDIRPHKRIDAEAVYNKMRAAYKTIKQPLIDAGVQVINVNTPEGTDLEEFPIKSVEEVFS